MAKEHKHEALWSWRWKSFLRPGKLLDEHSVRNEKLTFNSICKWIFGTPKESLKSFQAET